MPAVATLQLGRALHSNSFLQYGSGLVVIHILLWLTVLLMTIRGAWLGNLFHAPCLNRGPSVPGEVEAQVAADQMEERLTQMSSKTPMSDIGGESTLNPIDP